MNKNIAVLTLEVSANSSRIIKESKTLQKAGFLVKVYAIKNEGQRESEFVQGIEFHRFSLKTRKLPKTFLWQIIKFIEFYFLLKKHIGKVEIIDCHDLFMLLLGRLLKKKCQASRIILNAHELESEVLGLTNFRKRIVKFLESKLIKKADSVIVVSKSIENWYKNTYKLSNVFCIYNAPFFQETECSDVFRKIFSIPKESLVFLYQGGLSNGRGIELLLSTFSNLEQCFHIVFMGNGGVKSNIEILAQSHKNIHYLEAVPQNELYKYTSSADYGFSILVGDCINHQYCMPNKLFEYTMFEVPIIVSNTIDQSMFVRENQIGYVLGDYSEQGLSDLIHSLKAEERLQMKQRMKSLGKKISWECQEDKLIKIYEGE